MNDFDVNYKLKELNCSINDLTILVKKIQWRNTELQTEINAIRMVLEKQGLVPE